MKGYCYLDVEGTLNYKSCDYIDIENPCFWRDNDPFILMVWKFDTDDLSSMYKMYTRFKTLELKSDPVIEFSKTINFDIKTLKEYARSVRPNQDQDPVSA